MASLSLCFPAFAEEKQTMGKSEMQKIQRKKLQEEEKTFAKGKERLIELALEDDRRNVDELETEKADQMVWLMKCPPRVVKAWRDLSSDLVPVAKYTDSVNLLRPDFSPEVVNSTHPPLFLIFFLGEVRVNLGIAVENGIRFGFLEENCTIR